MAYLDLCYNRNIAPAIIFVKDDRDIYRTFNIWQMSFKNFANFSVFHIFTNNERKALTSRTSSTMSRLFSILNGSMPLKSDSNLSQYQIWQISNYLIESNGPISLKSDSNLTASIQFYFRVKICLNVMFGFWGKFSLILCIVD